MSNNVVSQANLAVCKENAEEEKNCAVISSNKSTSANSSESPSSNGEEYEIVQMMPATEGKSDSISASITGHSVPVTSTSPSLKIIGNGNETELQKTLEECCKDNVGCDEMGKEEIIVPSVTKNGKTTCDTSVENANELTINDENHTVFHNIKYLGAAVINDPKNERLIHSLMKELNVIDDLYEEEQDDEPDQGQTNTLGSGVGHEVMVRVPKSADGNVLVRCTSKDGSQESDVGIVGEFPIFRIIFFARGNSGTTEEACFAFTVAIPATPSLKCTGDAVKSSQPKVTFKCHAFRCNRGDTVTKVFTSFAYAFKKPQNEGKLNR